MSINRRVSHYVGDLKIRPLRGVMTTIWSAGWPVCGSNSQKGNTLDPKEVTCKGCLRLIARSNEPARLARDEQRRKAADQAGSDAP